MFSSASEVFINALCRVVTTYKIVVFKFRFVSLIISHTWHIFQCAYHSGNADILYYHCDFSFYLRKISPVLTSFLKIK